MLYNLKKNESKIYEIDKEIYSSIHDLGFRSYSDEEFKCVVAVKRNIVYQITVFDFFATNDEIKLNLNFTIKPTDQLRVKISRDFSRVVYAGMEQFIVEQKDGYTVQRKLNTLAGKDVHYIYEPLLEPS